jgi:predicted lipoprotein
MKRIYVFFFAGAVSALLLLNFACTKGGSNTGGNTTVTGTDTVLLNIGNNIILPGYQSLATAVNALDSSIVDFNASPNSTKLTNVQTIFKAAYTAWESVSEYNYFGPASTIEPTLPSLNIFRTNTTVIESNISSGTYTINTFANSAAKGFPALDYLLFGTDNATLLSNYTTASTAANRQQYLATVSADIKTSVNTVLNGWSAGGGNYINTFVTGTGNSVSSSLGLLLNSLDQDFEILKNDCLGIPLGKIPVGSSSPLAPTEVEAYYSGISLQLAIAQLKTVQGIYLGTAANGNGLGLNTYLTQVEQKNGLRYNGGLLSDTIKTTFNTAIAQLQAIPVPLSANLGNANVSAAFTSCQQLIALLKTDMPSDLGVLISYGDNDGD